MWQFDHVVVQMYSYLKGRKGLGEVGIKVKLGVIKVNSTSRSSGGSGLGMQLSVLSLGLRNELLLLNVLGLSLLGLSSRLEGRVVDKSVDDTSGEGGPSQNL
jgi:hypothetical protein